MEIHVKEIRNQVEQKIAEIPEILERVAELENEIESITERHLVRRKQHLITMRDDMLKSIEYIRGGEFQRKLEERAAPYIKAYNQISQQQKTTSTALLSDTTFTEHTLDRRGTLVKEYLAETEAETPTIQIQSKDDCPMCQSPMVLVHIKAIMCCGKCGYSSPYLDSTSTSISYNDDIDFASFSYKRINHFNEWLQQVQAKETTVIGDELVQNVMKELYKQRVSPKAVTHKKVREVLKVLKYRKAYEHVNQITSKITGESPPKLTPEIEEMCRLMFIAMQPAFEKHCPKDRKNFLSYSYCLYKFFQLLGYDGYLSSFTLLKGKDKLQKQDLIFKKICEELDWEFVPST